MTATFSKSELRALKASFYVKRATPDEVCLLIRPKSWSWHVRRAALYVLLFGGIGFALPNCLNIFEHNMIPREILVPELWGAASVLLILSVLVFVFLPFRYLPRFELLLRPGHHHLTMVGFGVQQNCHGGCCGIQNRWLWCNFAIDGVRYALLRRWWQILVPPGWAVAAVNRVLAPAKQHFTDLVAAGGGQEEATRSSSRSLWAKAFGEAFITHEEVVVSLLPASWWQWIVIIPALLGIGGPLFWHLFVPPWHCWVDGQRQLVCGLSKTPLWLPMALGILTNGLVCFWADPWFRRAIAIIPRGQRRIRVQIGGRMRGEYPFADNIWVHDLRDNESLGSTLYVSTPAWTGFKFAEPKLEEHQMAVWALRNWAEHERGSEGDIHG